VSSPGIVSAGHKVSLAADGVPGAGAGADGVPGAGVVPVVMFNVNLQEASSSD